MKTKFTFLFCSFFFIGFSVLAQSSVTTASSLPSGVSGDWYQGAAAYAKQVEYTFYQTGDHFRVTNSANLTRFEIHQKGYTARPMQTATAKASWQVDMLLGSISRNNKKIIFTAGHSISEQSNMLVHSFGFSEVQYINNDKGLRQNFIVNEKLPGEGSLAININVKTTLSQRVVNGGKLVFFESGHEDNIQLSYEDLHVWDAGKKELNAYMQLNEATHVLSIIVDDKDAVYPVTVDPINKTAEWSTSANGVLPSLLNSLSLQAASLYGYTVANLGDINHDGYDDVAIGAPAMADVVSSTGSLLGVGAVFIYYGSASGLSATPSKVLQPTTAAAGALFGFSIEAGNITPDGYNDVLIGAPMDTYQATAGGLLGDVSVSVTAGKVYLYRSEDFPSASNPSPFLQLHLDGNDYFNTGVLGLLNNTSIKALYGFSIGVTGDLNGDGREDIIIGCPSYAGIAALSVQSGAAFVYYSNNLSTTTPVKLNVPTPSILGLISLPVANLNGLLFGFSVEGIGDYNNDGFADVVVGAPAGLDLSSLGGIFSGQVLGGSAYVYYGNGSGVSSIIGATLQASSSGLLGNAANLFGYKIKAVKNASGVRNGNVLISAPAGSVVSNVVNGLRLKAGQIHLFKKKTGAFTSPVSSDQALSSPRSSSVLSLLSGQNLNVSLLYGASMDNARDVNCDGIADIVVGEPLSTNVALIGANVTGGSAYIYTGKPDGTYQTTPSWSMFAEVSPLLGVNATSLLGFSVAGGIHDHGAANNYRALVGGPTNSLDFGSGLLNLGNTVGTLTNFTFDNNGLGKAYTFETNTCLITLPARLTSFKGHVEGKTVKLDWQAEEESNVSRYDLERSTDGVNFQPIAMVFAQNKSHNEYNYPDMHPAQGVNYYRLNIIDNDSRHVYSNVVSFRFDEKLPGLMVVAPNPVHEIIRVRLTGMETGTYYMKIFNMNGQLNAVRKINIGQYDQVETMDREAVMNRGTYTLGLYDVNGKNIRTVKLVID